MKQEPFRKRTFTLPLFLSSTIAAATHLPVLGVALARPATSRALREEVMLAVTSVNDCRYCSWVHTGLALEHGVDMESLGALLGRELKDVTDNDAIAILFGKHFADTGRRPDTAARDRLRSAFSWWQRREIMAYIHAIYFANLTGNSADAVLARLRGQEAEGNPGVQLIAAVLGAPILFGIWLASRRDRARPLAEG